ncbi:MAG: nucleoside-diphosphate kinase [Candidatus Campbellbacteria bacterium]|nr:nucleoside-diphosphate kinase [Candidatus Campbellbacteria bacterium]
MKNEKTLVIVKPDGVQRSLIGEIITRMERVGLKLVAIKILIPDDETVRKHYTVDPMWIKGTGEKLIENLKNKGSNEFETPEEAGKSVLNNLVKFMTCGPVVAMVWQGANAVQLVRKLVGTTEPLSSDVGTIRGDLVLDSYKLADVDGRAVRNIIHASSSTEDADKEVAVWFDNKELLKYRLIAEQIIYDVNIDGLKE